MIAALVLARTVCPVLRSRKQIVLTRVDGGLRAELHGDLATIASFAQEREGVSKNAGPAGIPALLAVVAGARNQRDPYTLKIEV